MLEVRETACPRLLGDVAPHELEQLCTPTPEERASVRLGGLLAETSRISANPQARLTDLYYVRTWLARRLESRRVPSERKNSQRVCLIPRRVR